MRIAKVVTVAQMVSWVVFILGDYVDEAISDSSLLFTAIVVQPFAMPVLYLVFKKRIHYHEIPGWVNTLTALAIWDAENICLAMASSALMAHGMWFIHQAYGGWDDFLNGIEYMIFLFVNIFVPTAIVALWNLAVFIYKKIESRH